MTKTMMVACLALVLSGCANAGGQSVPRRQDLLSTASAQGKYHVTIERYNAKERIAVVRTPGWKPETKPYQFDGKQWVPLWSPYAALAVDNRNSTK